jgi:hypothetical protein
MPQQSRYENIIIIQLLRPSFLLRRKLILNSGLHSPLRCCSNFQSQVWEPYFIELLFTGFR